LKRVYPYGGRNDKEEPFPLVNAASGMPLLEYLWAGVAGKPRGKETAGHLSPSLL
jgi:hypothetical protein